MSLEWTLLQHGWGVLRRWQYGRRRNLQIRRSKNLQGLEAVSCRLGFICLAVGQGQSALCLRCWGEVRCAGRLERRLGSQVKQSQAMGTLGGSKRFTRENRQDLMTRYEGLVRGGY